MSEIDELRARHLAHLKEAQEKGEKGRACTVQAVSDAHLSKYESLLASLSPVVKLTVDYLIKIIRGQQTVPSIEELNKLDSLLDSVIEDSARNAVFHMFWHVKELSLGRKPQ